MSEDIEEQGHNQRPLALSHYTCPDCGDSLRQLDDGLDTRFRCHVGHAYAADLLPGLKTDEVEAALWTCVRLLTEKATLTRQLGERVINAVGGSGARYLEQAAYAERQAQVIRELLEVLPTPVSEQPTPTADGEASASTV
jgi:two-component system chemotaxis response regulator CheB